MDTKIEYNGWFVFFVVLFVIIADDLPASIGLMVLLFYIMFIENLKFRYKKHLKEDKNETKKTRKKN